MSKVIYPPCKYCGATHGMGFEDTETGVITPIDVCKDCLFPPNIFSPAIDQVELDEWIDRFSGKDEQL